MDILHLLDFRPPHQVAGAETNRAPRKRHANAAYGVPFHHVEVCEGNRLTALQTTCGASLTVVRQRVDKA